MSEEESADKVEFKGAGFAADGGEPGTVLADLDAGEYAHDLLHPGRRRRGRRRRTSPRACSTSSRSSSRPTAADRGAVAADRGGPSCAPVWLAAKRGNYGDRHPNALEGAGCMQGVIKSYDPGSGDGVVLCDTDFKEYDLAARCPRRARCSGCSGRASG